MSNPTLGYEEDTKISKTEIATFQLNEAISLFIENKFLCALTLAGAAEEVLARLVNSKGDKSIVERSFDSIQKIREIGFSAQDNLQKNKVFKQWNEGRNTVKHHSEGETEMVTINLFDEAYWIIERALANAKYLDVCIENENDFENWCMVQLHL